MARIEITKSLTEAQTTQIDHLWNELYPTNLENRFRQLLNGIEEYNHHVLLNETDIVMGWTAAFRRDGEIWFSILVPTENQNKGYGKMLIDSLKQSSKILCGWVIDHNNYLKKDGSTYYSPMQFYLKNGFLITNIRLETDLISAVKIKFEA